MPLSKWFLRLISKLSRLPAPSVQSKPIPDPATSSETNLESPEIVTIEPPIWGVVANVVEIRSYGPGGREIRRGTRKFNSGQKVYVFDNRIESTAVIGRYRGKHGYITCYVRTHFLENFRAKLIYSPTIVDRMVFGYSEPGEIQLTQEYLVQHRQRMPIDGSEESRQCAEQLATHLNEIAEQGRKEVLEKIQRQASNIDSEIDDSV